MAEKVVQSVDCSNTADAVSHKVDDRKTDGNKVEMTWTPDKDYGEVIFRLVKFLYIDFDVMLQSYQFVWLVFVWNLCHGSHYTG